MALWDDVETIVTRLSGRGWGKLLLQHGLDLGAADLRAELLRDSNGIDRAIAGFADFAGSGRRGLEPGDPARSLFYHALASPLVHPTAAGKPSQNADDYPTPLELDTIENLIYALAASSVQIGDLALAIFSYEYRPADGTAHGAHADLVFSRAAIARNGTLDPKYNAALRCFEGIPPSNADCFVSPARYGLFLARRMAGRSAGTAFALHGGSANGDQNREFLVPVHKLFGGQECLPNQNLTVEFHHRHINEKLHKAATIDHGIPVDHGFDTSAPPFRIVCEGNYDPAQPVQHPAVQIQAQGSMVLVRPSAGPLILDARQTKRGENAASLVTFKVPKATAIVNEINRRYTSYRIAEDWLALAREGIDSLLENVFAWLGVSDRFPRPRNAPEFVNIRHKVVNGQITDMLTAPSDRNSFRDAVRNGGYEAALFLDGCADGCLTARITAADKHFSLPPVRPAFSIVAPPDFFPSIDQMELKHWLRNHKLATRDQFAQGGPDPLSIGRLPANQDTIDPMSGSPAFKDGDETLVAMVAQAPRGLKSRPQNSDISDRTSFLPDASSTVFAPGWDVTYAAHDGGKPFYATYGLGSPFPEDAKLCAAANSYWPAVSPDASRTFGRSDAPTAMPLMDEELGYHHDHPWVHGGQFPESRGWDGEQGPFISADGMNINYVDIERSDYVTNSRAGRMSFKLLSEIDADEMGQRMDALRAALAVADDGKTPAETKLWLVSAVAVKNWGQQAPGTAGPSGPLVGPGYRYLFARLPDGSSDGTPVPGNPIRVTRPIAELIRCRIAVANVRLDRATPGAGAMAFYTL